MQDNTTIMVPMEEVDGELVDIYDMVSSALKNKDNPDDFMEVVTTTLIIDPDLITLNHILYIINDKNCRHPKLIRESGRHLIKLELDLLNPFLWEPNMIIDYFTQKIDWNEEELYKQEELVCVFHCFMHAYQLSYWLREHADTTNRLYVNFQLLVSGYDAAGPFAKDSMESQEQGGESKAGSVVPNSMKEKVGGSDKDESEKNDGTGVEKDGGSDGDKDNL